MSLETWIWQIMVLAIITWETSTMVPVSSVSQDNIFHIPVWLDIWRCRTTRINVRLNAQHRKTTNSNGHQVCRVFSRTQWERILFVCYETSEFDLAPNITQSFDDQHRDPWSVDHRWEIHGSLESTHGYLFVFTFPPSMFGCSMFQVLCPVFFEKRGTQSK